MRTTAFLGTVVLACFAVVGCAKKPIVKDASDDGSHKKRAGVHVSDDIMRLCKIQMDNIVRAPKFDYDDAELLPEDRDVLEQVAKCVTTGPLKGKQLALVGRCDPRGEAEYNMVLGDYRAESVHDFLAKLGVDPQAMAKTSRGNLDAEGNDEDSYRLDRRVDISLKGENVALSGNETKTEAKAKSASR